MFNGMNNKTFLLAVTLVFMWVAAQLNVQAQGYHIKLKIDNLQNTDVMLGHHFANLKYLDDTIRLNAKGMGEFSGKNKLPEGMYFIYLPSKSSYFDILIGDQQNFSIEDDTTDFVNRFRSSGSLENQEFYDYQKFLMDKSKLAKDLQDKIKAAISEDQKKTYREHLSAIDKEVSAHIGEVIKKNPNLFFSTFLKATVDVDVPDFPRDSKGKVLDSLFQYRYYRTHYFDNFDFTDARLLRTPLYEGKFRTYYEKVIPQIPDSIIPEVDMLINKARKDPEVFRYVLVTLFNSFASSQIMGMDKVFIHIAEKYYIPEASWSAPDFIEKLKKQVAERKPLLIGNIAPNIQLVEVPAEHFIQAADDTAAMKNPYVGGFFNLRDVKAKYTILIFWDADCGHCQMAMPVLHDIYEKLKNQDVKVVAVHTLGGIEGKEKWVKYVTQHNDLDWINAWNPYDFSYKEVYDVKSTPVLFLLDENKKILAKQITPEQVYDLVQYLIKSGGKM